MRGSVLLVEDDQDLREELADYLGASGFSVRCAGSIAEAEAQLKKPVAVLVLDINLPDGDGVDLCRSLRKRRLTSGIIMCTGRSEQGLRIHSLKDGADAYLVKPVDPELLEATIISLMRRLKLNPLAFQPAASQRPWELDHRRAILTAPNGVSTQLTTLEGALIEHLAKQSDQRSNHADMILALDKVSPGYSGQRLEALISRLRRKVTRNGGMQLALVSEYGRGYVFNEHIRLI